jgi:hypothetical protein
MILFLEATTMSPPGKVSGVGLPAEKPKVFGLELLELQKG